MRTTSNAWTGEIGRQDLAGVGALRARKTRGGLTTGPTADVWRIGDLGALAGGEIPGYIVDRLRAFAASRSADTGNDCPADAQWSIPAPAVPMYLGEWSDQSWHAVTLEERPPRGLRARPRGYRTNGAVPTIPPASRAELLTDLRWSREVAAGTVGRRARLAARAVAFAN